MTRPPLTPSVAQLGNELELHGLSGWIWPWTFGVLRQFARVRLANRYPPGVYSPTGTWDAEGIGDLVTDFICEPKARHALRRAIHSAAHVQGVVRYLEKAFLNYVVEERGASVAGNVYARLRQVLETDPELAPYEGFGAATLYGLKEWSNHVPPALSDHDLQRAAAFLPEVLERVEYLQGVRRSPVVSTRSIRETVMSVCRGTGRLVSARQIMAVLDDRLGLRQPPDLPLDDGALVAEPAASPLEAAVAAELAQQLLDRLTERQVDVLNEWASGRTVREIGERVGCGKSVVSEEQQRIRRVTAELPIGGSREADQVLSAALTLIESRATGQNDPMPRSMETLG